MAQQNTLKWDIPWSALFKIVLVAAVAYALFLIRDILILALAALVISIIFNPAINFLSKKRIPHPVAAVLVYLVVVGIIGLLVYLAAPPIIEEVGNFYQNFSDYFSEFMERFSELFRINLLDWNSLLNNSIINDNLLNVSKNIINFLYSFIGGTASMVTMFVLAFFLSVEENELTKMIKSFAPKKWEEDILKAWQKSQEQVMGWFGGRLIASLAVALMTFIVCLFLNIKLAVSISLISGMLNLVPLIGPIISGALLFLLGILNSWQTAFLLLIFSIIIQFIENNLLTPFVSKQIIGIPNFLVLLSILIGGQLLGAVGAILAIPLAAVVYETLRNYIVYKKENE
ncbi:MAG TPA: AI-2E family transporter [Candidatus Pacearchaeota archaeon]|nr:AI-2E family transporter [Candidatus Pacearchaeota archaeon]